MMLDLQNWLLISKKIARKFQAQFLSKMVQQIAVEHYFVIERVLHFGPI